MHLLPQCQDCGGITQAKNGSMYLNDKNVCFLCVVCVWYVVTVCVWVYVVYVVYLWCVWKWDGWGRIIVCGGVCVGVCAVDIVHCMCI